MISERAKQQAREIWRDHKGKLISGLIGAAALGYYGYNKADEWRNEVKTEFEQNAKEHEREAQNENLPQFLRDQAARQAVREREMLDSGQLDTMYSKPVMATGFGSLGLLGGAIAGHLFDSSRNQAKKTKKGARDK
jgi:hypothetical protein